MPALEGGSQNTARLDLPTGAHQGDGKPLRRVPRIPCRNGPPAAMRARQRRALHRDAHLKRSLRCGAGRSPRHCRGELSLLVGISVRPPHHFSSTLDVLKSRVTRSEAVLPPCRGRWASESAFWIEPQAPGVRSSPHRSLPDVPPEVAEFLIDTRGAIGARGAPRVLEALGHLLVEGPRACAGLRRRPVLPLTEPGPRDPRGIEKTLRGGPCTRPSGRQWTTRHGHRFVVSSKKRTTGHLRTSRSIRSSAFSCSTSFRRLGSRRLGSSRSPRPIQLHDPSGERLGVHPEILCHRVDRGPRFAHDTTAPSWNWARPSALLDIASPYEMTSTERREAPTFDGRAHRTIVCLLAGHEGDHPLTELRAGARTNTASHDCCGEDRQGH